MIEPLTTSDHASDSRPNATTRGRAQRAMVMSGADDFEVVDATIVCARPRSGAGPPVLGPEPVGGAGVLGAAIRIDIDVPLSTNSNGISAASRSAIDPKRPSGSLAIAR